MRNFRPIDWDETYESYRDLYKGVSRSEILIFEAGADAILDAMWKLAEESPTKTFTIDANCNQVYSQKPPDSCNSEET